MTATPLSVSVPAAGSVVISTASEIVRRVSFGSLNPKSAAVNTYAVSSSVVTVLFAPSGASFTDVTLSVIVRGVVSVLHRRSPFRRRPAPGT